MEVAGVASIVLVAKVALAVEESPEVGEKAEEAEGQRQVVMVLWEVSQKHLVVDGYFVGQTEVAVLVKALLLKRKREGEADLRMVAVAGKEEARPMEVVVVKEVHSEVVVVVDHRTVVAAVVVVRSMAAEGEEA